MQYRLRTIMAAIALLALAFAYGARGRVLKERRCGPPILDPIPGEFRPAAGTAGWSVLRDLLP